MATNRTAVLLFLLTFVGGFICLHAQTLPDAPAAPEEEKIILQFPGNPASEVASFYEELTGKHLVRDSALNGVALTILTPPPGVTKKEAIALIESSFVLNGYSIVDVDETTAKILGTNKPARSEAVPLYTDPSQLPVGDEYVSYFMPFRYLKAENAAKIFEQYAPPHNKNSGSYAVVESVNAIVITETAPLIRRLIALKDVIDVEGARTDTKFFQLVRADAEKIAEILNKLFEKNEDGPGQPLGRVNNVPQAGRKAPIPGGGVPPAAAGIVSGIPGKVQIFADKRTNRVMVVAPEAQMPYIQEIVENLDAGTEIAEVLERPLRFVRAGDVLPVLTTLLAEGDDKGAGGGLGSNDTSRNPNDSNSSGGFGRNGSGNGDLDNGGSSGASLGSLGAESSTPESVIVGSSRLIADRSVNKIIVIGPPEARSKAARVLDMLDQRPKQVYLACVIGQLEIGNNLDFGIDYLMKFGDVRILGQGDAANINRVIANRAASVDLLPDTDTVVDGAVGAAASAVRSALPVTSGLTVFGSIADSVDILARALASTNRFQIISRPMIYTANGQIAKISSGQDVPYASNTLADINSTSSNVNNVGTTVSSNTEFKKVQLELEVRPLINSDKEVTLNISQTNDTLGTSVTISAGTTAPTINTQRLDTTITVPNRQTVVLGGLISDQEDRLQTGIPFLKDIPGLGYLFSSVTKTKRRRELIVMIQPFIISNDVDLAEANMIERANTSFREGLFDKPLPVKRATLPGPGDIIPEEIH